jgi:hypothetical protein
LRIGDDTSRITHWAHTSILKQAVILTLSTAKRKNLRLSVGRSQANCFRIADNSLGMGFLCQSTSAVDLFALKTSLILDELPAPHTLSER